MLVETVDAMERDPHAWWEFIENSLSTVVVIRIRTLDTFTINDVAWRVKCTAGTVTMLRGICGEFSSPIELSDVYEHRSFSYEKRLQSCSIEFITDGYGVAYTLMFSGLVSSSDDMVYIEEYIPTKEEVFEWARNDFKTK